MEVQEYLGDENQGRQKWAISSHRKLWQVSQTHPPSQKFVHQVVLEPIQKFNSIQLYLHNTSYEYQVKY